MVGYAEPRRKRTEFKGVAGPPPHRHRNSTAVMQEPRDAAEQMEALSRAFARNDESLRERTDEVERLRGTLAEYEELRSTLRTLPERVEHEVMIRVRARGWSAASAPRS